MEKKPETREKIRKTIIKDMKKMGTYRPEFNKIIDIYAELLGQYAHLNQKFIDSDYAFQVETGQGGTKKAPIIAIMENLRKDILSYSDRLQLNPKAANEKGDGSGSGDDGLNGVLKLYG